MNRNRLVAGSLGLVVAAGGLGWLAGSRISSPAEAAARAEAPEPSLITVAVDERLLSADIVARGTIDFDDPVSLALSGSIGDTESKQIVTMVPEVGAELAEGAVALEVSGRPVILLQGELPVYRDLRPGSKGDDVLQLEQSLVRLGLMKAADSTWDNATGAGVQALYARVGHTANAASSDDKAQLDAARDQVRAANEALQDAQRAISEAGGASGSSLLEAQAAVADAQGSLTIAQNTRTSSVGAANGAVSVAVQALADADNAGTPAAGSADYVALEAAIDDANNALALVKVEQDAAVAATQRQLDIAKARLAEARNPGDVTALNRARDDARRQVADATEALVRIESTVGTWIPAGELIFLKRVPVQVARTEVERGDEVSTTFMTVSGSDIAMTIGLSESEAMRLSVGDTVIIDEPDLLEETIEATVSEIPEAGSSGRVQVTVLLDTVPETLLGANVRVIIPVESTSGEVLVVPAAALSAVANGDTRVEVEEPNAPGTTRYVTVVTGLATDGVVEVRAVEGKLVKGDRVVVGQADIGGVPADGDEGEDEGSDQVSDEPSTEETQAG
ncbi:hypothetical protein LGT39_07435 [Demequina sp. TTPB684]|uniref:hypothetical protein n=1 Tax=unclassified Demequina TaxID=2620311 RepID=UPI001CF52BAE|nr:MULTISPECIES: hypothetical protein [unclassified Demequina]MCB2412674.1 hypothetical protein [Demequina sp. TTPB684]UPU87957.1 hypothetical protein LGT36_012005 [Demequina sp. TMPB413]